MSEVTGREKPRFNAARLSLLHRINDYLFVTNCLVMMTRKKDARMSKFGTTLSADEIKAAVKLVRNFAGKE